MQLYYVEYNASKNDNETIAHYLEITNLGVIVEHKVPVNEEQSVYPFDWVYTSWSEYYSTYRGGKANFNKNGRMVRLV